MVQTSTSHASLFSAPCVREFFVKLYPYFRGNFNLKLFSNFQRNISNMVFWRKFKFSVWQFELHACCLARVTSTFPCSSSLAHKGLKDNHLFFAKNTYIIVCTKLLFFKCFLLPSGWFYSSWDVIKLKVKRTIFKNLHQTIELIKILCSFHA